MPKDPTIAVRDCLAEIAVLQGIPARMTLESFRGDPVVRRTGAGGARPDRAVQIGPDGWGMIGSPPVRFRRPAGMLPIPAPERGGSIEALASFLNLPSRNDFVLVVGWPLAALRFGDPYRLLATSGEQGSAKTVSVHR